MSGNVVEWCWDWYGNISSNTPSSGLASGSNRCSRGGSWLSSYKSYCEVVYRGYSNPSNRDLKTYGFRLVRTAE